MPPLSVRVDPFMWLLDGKLGFELEAGLAKFLSVELVPVFVTNEQPPTFGYFSGSRDDGLSRGSGGWGPLAGTSVDLGFWIEGKALRGSVLRVIFTNYSYEYTSRLGGKEIDQFTHVERQLLGYFGSHSRFGAFTIAGGLGLGVELNSDERCYNRPEVNAKPTKGCGRMDIKLDPNATTVVDLSGGLGGVQILARISFGVTFD
ncbi:MAG TPA: hypothetical protein VF103_05470 [Polyangiaceae bacterium]